MQILRSICFLFLLTLTIAGHANISFAQDANDPNNLQWDDSVDGDEQEDTIEIKPIQNVKIDGESKELFRGFDVEMPKIPTFSKEQIGEKMRYVEKLRPWDDIYSGFRMFVPKNWEDTPDTVIRNTKKGQRVFGEIARFQRSFNDVITSTITIESFELGHNISAKNWLVKYMLDYGYVFEGVSEDDWNRAAALGTVYDQESYDYKNYLVAIRSGGRIIMMRYSVPTVFWEEEKSYQVSVGKSFKMITADDDISYEMVTYDITGYAEFQYPATWNLGNLNQNDFDRPYIKLISVDNQHKVHRTYGDETPENLSKGIIHVQVVLYHNTTSSLTEELESQKQIIEGLGIKVGDKLSHNVDIIFPVDAQLATLEIYQGENEVEKNENYEVWLAYMKNEESYIFVTMVTPTSDLRYYAWTENKNAFGAIASSMQAISYYDEDYDE